MINIVTETVEPQFFGELKEMYYDNGGEQIWQTEQWHTLPDQYTGAAVYRSCRCLVDSAYLYLLTSDWESEQSRVYYYGCPDITQDQLHAWNSAIPASNTAITGTQPRVLPGQCHAAR